MLAHEIMKLENSRNEHNLYESEIIAGEEEQDDGYSIVIFRWDFKKWL